MGKDGIKRNLGSFLSDESGFVSRDSLLKVGGASLVFSCIVLGLSSSGQGYSSHTNVSGDATHVNCLTHPGGCGQIGHENAIHHIDHTSNCY